MNIVRPFGPTIAKLKMPNNIVEQLNAYSEKVILDRKKIEEIDNGKNLAGNVKQEFLVEKDVLDSSGFYNFLKKSVSMWLEASDKKKNNSIHN